MTVLRLYQHWRHRATGDIGQLVQVSGVGQEYVRLAPVLVVDPDDTPFPVLADLVDISTDPARAHYLPGRRRIDCAYVPRAQLEAEWTLIPRPAGGRVVSLTVPDSPDEWNELRLTDENIGQVDRLVRRALLKRGWVAP